MAIIIMLEIQCQAIFTFQPNKKYIYNRFDKVSCENSPKSNYLDLINRNKRCYAGINH